jgi:tetratricopeptide (TPR) repeat protein
LIDETGQIVKVYAGPVSRQQIETDFNHIPRTAAESLRSALPFPGETYDASFRRNYLSYGSVFFQRGYIDQAEGAFRLALRDDPASAEALYGLGSVYLQQGKLAESRDSFSAVVKLTSTYPDTIPSAWNNLGLIATKEGKIEEALLAFQQALRINPDHLIALENLGNAYRQLKRWDDAQTTLQRALALKPEDPDANYSLGMVFAQINNTDAAYEHLQRALQFRPDYPEALNNLGILYLRTQRRDEAVATFEQCIRIAPAFDQAYINLARVYALEQQPAKARALLQELLKQHPGHMQAQQALDQLSH